MSYHYLEGITSADIAFEATGESPEELFISAWNATLQVMISNTNQIYSKIRKKIELEVHEADVKSALPILLHDLLQRLIFYKDAESLLLTSRSIRIFPLSLNQGWGLELQAEGDFINPKIHELGTDVKSVTWHQFEVKKANHIWSARVVLDI